MLQTPLQPDRWERGRPFRIGLKLATLVLILCSLGFYALHACRHVRRPVRRSSQPVKPSAQPLSGVTVVIDPGHGGQDSGARVDGATEAELTYRLAVELCHVLHALGANVAYTVHSSALDPSLFSAEPPPKEPVDAVLASTGKPVVLRVRDSPRELWDRGDIGRQAWQRQSKRDHRASRDVFFISLHFDSAWPHSIHGGAVYFDPRSGCLPALASLISEELGRDATQRHASYRGRQGLSTGEMGVLDPAHNPVPEKILFEVGTITNDSDRKQAFDPFWRRAMARLIARAVVQVHQGD